MAQAGYSTTALREKLGLRSGMRAALLAMPATVLHELALDFKTEDHISSATQYDYIHFFTHSHSELEKNFAGMKEHLDQAGMLWISWPKKSAKVETDLDENRVREIGLKNGLVDVKVCAVDATWSGLKFLVRKKDRARRTADP